MKNHLQIKKLTLTALFTAVAVVGSMFSFPVLGSKCAPVQHLVNVLCAVTVGPWWGLAQAFMAALIRNLTGLGSPLAFPGSMCGALLAGLLYQYGKKLPFAYVGEVFGTGIIGGMLSYPIAYLIMGNKAAALFTFVVPFLISTCGGTIIAIIVTIPLKRPGYWTGLPANEQTRVESRKMREPVMKFSGKKVAEIHEKIQQIRPIIHCITNAVTVNDCANILLAAGASPTMAHHPCEVEEITTGTAALICNFGAISDYEAMETAGKRAHALGHPIVIDPVGVSGSSYRREKCLELMKIIHPTCIRGNYSEIQALLHNCGTVTGVDAAEDALAEAEETDLPELMKQYAKENQMILVASGEADLITDGSCVYRCHNGSPMMARITGSGCMSTVMLGAFLSAENSVESAVACCAFTGIAGELAAKETTAQKRGTMTFRNGFIDAVSLMTPEQLEHGTNVDWF